MSRSTFHWVVLLEESPTTETSTLRLSGLSGRGSPVSQVLMLIGEAAAGAAVNNARQPAAAAARRKLRKGDSPGWDRSVPTQCKTLTRLSRDPTAVVRTVLSCFCANGRNE